VAAAPGKAVAAVQHGLDALLMKKPQEPEPVAAAGGRSWWRRGGRK
jgi:hypothetical protein